ncbi:Copia protein, partial [Mucuna pruriens]
MNDYVSYEGLFEDEVHMALMVSIDPLHFEEAMKSANWRLAMDNEIKSIKNNQNWTLTEPPVVTKKIGVKWVYKTKYNEHGRLTGYSQKHGVDYREDFTLVTRMDTLDVKLAFLHGELSEEPYELGVIELKAHLICEGFRRCNIEPTLFTKRNKEEKIIFLSAYDLIFIGNCEIMMLNLKALC